MLRIGIGSDRKCHDWESLLNSYSRYVTSDSTVLEIGASNVERTKDLSRLCRRLIGIEVSPERLPEDFGNVKYLVGDWQRLSEKVDAGSIDVAVSSHVLEHVKDDLRALEELYVVLKPGGTALLNTPNRKRLVRAFIEYLAGEREFPHWEHEREYVEEDIVSLIERSSFERFRILPVALGLLGGPVYVYSEQVPDAFRRCAAFWEVHLFR